ncbi:MAG: DUF2066 domain-containing protein [Micavibrio sp.]
MAELLPVYRQSVLFRTVLYGLALMILTVCAIGKEALAVENDYTVEGVEVDVTAKNAVMAREAALAQAQIKAYEELAARLLPPERLQSFKAPDADTISMFVQDFEVTNEQLSTTRYKGTYTVRFRPTAIRQQFALGGPAGMDGYHPAAAGQLPSGMARPVLVLPMFEQSGRVTLWADQNPWMQAWRSLPEDRSMAQPTALPLGDIQDIGAIGDHEGLHYDPMRVQEMATRYQAEDVAVLLASAAALPNGQGQLVVNIYHNGFEGPRFVQKLTLDQLPGETDAALMTRAATRVKFMMRENWKGATAYHPQAAQTQQQQTPQLGSYRQTHQAPPAGTYTPRYQGNNYEPRMAGSPQVPPHVQGGPPDTAPYHTRQALGTTTAYVATARFASAQDWVRMKNALDRVYGMQAVMVKALKPREAQIELRYAGTIPALQSALQGAGMTMRGGYNGTVIELFFSPAGSHRPAY